MSHAPLDLLCIEPRFPGRLGGVADWLVRKRGYRVRFFCNQTSPPEQWPASTGRGIEVIGFNVGGLARESRVEWPKVLERGLCYSYGCWEVLDSRRPRPVDVVLGRSNGLGSAMFAPVACPGSPVVQFFDSYFDPARREPDDDAEQRPPAYRQWRLAANAIELLDLENGVIPWTATNYQRSLFPVEYRGDFRVVHDGVETRALPPRNRDPLTINGRTITPDVKLVTFVARSLDRLRGFDRFVRIVDRLMRENPGVVAVALGESLVDHPFDFAHYGRDYPAIVLGESPSTHLERLWMPGTVAPQDLCRILVRSDLHIYASRPHPASRSLLEAMSAGCVVMAFDAEAVREIVEADKTGLIVSRDVDDASRKALAVIRDPEGYRPLGDAAAERVRANYSRDVTLPRLVSLFDDIVAGRR